MMPKPHFDPCTMSPAQEPEPSPLCAACGEPAPCFYEGQLCRTCYRDQEDQYTLARHRILEEEKEEHLDQYIAQFETEYKKWGRVYGFRLHQIARELRLINAGVAPTDIRDGTYPNLEELPHED